MKKVLYGQSRWTEESGVVPSDVASSELVAETVKLVGGNLPKS